MLSRIMFFSTCCPVRFSTASVFVSPFLWHWFDFQSLWCIEGISQSLCVSVGRYDRNVMGAAASISVLAGPSFPHNPYLILMQKLAAIISILISYVDITFIILSRKFFRPPKINWHKKCWSPSLSRHYSTK